MKRITIAVATIAALGACATHSGIMERDDGTFTISAAAAPIRGGAVGARKYAMEQAQEYCQQTGQRAVLIERPDEMQSTGQVGFASGNLNASPYGANAHSSAATGPAFGPGMSSIAFRCKS